MKKPIIGLVLAVSLGATCVSESATKGVRASGTLQVGISNFNRGYIAKALPYFERAAEQSPNSEMAWVWLARAHQKQGTAADFAQAKTAFQKVLSINPNNFEALSGLGELWSWEPDRRNEAVRLLKHAHSLTPSDAATSKKLAEALFWQGDSAEALQYAAPIAQHYAHDQKFMGEYAQMLSQTGQAEQALSIYNTTLKTESSRDPATKLNLARAFLKDGQPQRAQELYHEVNQSVQGTALSRDANFAQAMAGLAFDLGLPGESIQWDQSLPPALQRQKDIQLRMARAYTRAGRKPEAIEKFQRLYDSGLLDVNEKLEYADYLSQLNLEPDALPAPNVIETLYQDALKEDPDNGDVYLHLARLYAEKPDSFTEVVHTYQKALNTENLSNRPAVQKEFLDYIKSDKTQPAQVDSIFQQMLSENPDDLGVKTAYAEFLSWQTDRRAEALRMYTELAKANPEQAEIWQGRIEEVLKWHKPSTDLIPVYQEIVNAYPQSKPIWLTVARAYRNDKNYYKEAIETYNTMVQRYPNDGTIKREWLDLLTANSGQRGENIKLLQKMSADQPNDPDIRATYGKLLSYDHKYGEAMTAFDDVLQQSPENFEALVGKGYVILWSGKKFEAKNYFSELRQKYPDNVDIALGLAQTEKMIGRYDQAIKIIEEIRPLMQKNPESGCEFNPNFITVAYNAKDNSLLAQASYDFSILPYGSQSESSTLNVAPESSQPAAMPKYDTAPEATPIPQAAAIPQTPVSASITVNQVPVNPEVRSLQSEVNALTEAVNSLKALQQSSRRQLDRIGQSVSTTRDVASGATYLQREEALATGQPGGTGSRMRTIGDSGMTPAYGTYAAIDSDTNPLLSGMGRFKNDELSDVEKGLLNELRPMIRTGYQYSTQNGADTTTGMNSWGFPSQLSFSLTPQIRLRGGLRPVKYYLPDGVSPSSTWGWEYGFGTTVKYWDRLTLDTDLAITHFTQSKTENLTFQTQAAYAINDSITVKLGARRLPQYNSLLSVAGLYPGTGAFRNELVGQARENTFYGEINTHPFSQNLDWNLGYEWGFVEGSHIPNNTKNQAFTSAGYTWHYASNHQVRLGYEFLYFGYSKNATNGYFDTTAVGLNKPVVSLNPVLAANSGYVFGGYYSPHMFIMNAGRLDFRGSLFNKFLEYKLGGSLGAQTIRLGHQLDNKEDGSGTKLAGSFDGNLIMNLTDWLAAYGNVDFLNAGQQFSRWRFGGGLILRPHIAPLSPVFGQPIDRRR